MLFDLALIAGLVRLIVLAKRTGLRRQSAEGVELLQPQLRVDSHKLSQVPKRGFLGLGLGAGVIGESLKALCAVALLGDVGRHRPVLGEKGILARI